MGEFTDALNTTINTAIHGTADEQWANSIVDTIAHKQSLIDTALLHGDTGMAEALQQEIANLRNIPTLTNTVSTLIDERLAEQGIDVNVQINPIAPQIPADTETVASDFELPGTTITIPDNLDASTILEGLGGQGDITADTELPASDGLDDALVYLSENGRGEGLTGNHWEFNAEKDVDMRGGATYQDALDEAFRRSGVPKEQFTVTAWGGDRYGKTIPTEYTGPNGSSVNIDIPKWNNVKSDGTLGAGPHQPHIGYQTQGKGRNRTRGHIFVDETPATRR